MTFLSGMPASGGWVLILFISLMFVLTIAIFALVFYTTKKYLTERINTLTRERNMLLARLQENQ
jgi:hypothetical protein